MRALDRKYGAKQHAQSARQWWKKFESFLKSIGFENCKAEPCLFKKVDKDGTVYFCLYVDDALMIGDRAAIDKAKGQIKQEFVIKELGELEEYIGCEVTKTDAGYDLSQKDIIKKLEVNFGSDVKSMMKYNSPMTGRVVRPDEEAPKLPDGKQSRYRSGVGMLLYLVKHSRPDLSNSVRELAKVMDGATEAHWKDMMRAIKYVIDTKEFCLLLKEDDTKAGLIEAFCDSDFAGDTDTRRSVTGYVVHYNGIMVAWKSRAQKVVSLSSSEAEYYAISECVTEMLYTKQVIEFMGLPIQLPMKLKVDNMGAIYLANNAFTEQRTKHIDCRVHFVRDLIQNVPPILSVDFVKSEDNKADSFTKNLNGATYMKHIKWYMSNTDAFDDETDEKGTEKDGKGTEPQREDVEDPLRELKRV